jgi:hypothetical protein
MNAAGLAGLSRPSVPLLCRGPALWTRREKQVADFMVVADVRI